MWRCATCVSAVADIASLRYLYFGKVLEPMQVRHDLRSAKSRFQNSSEHSIGWRSQAFVALFEHTLLSWHRCLTSMGVKKWNCDIFAISSDRPGVDLGFGSSFDYLPATEAVLACTSKVASSPTEPVSRCPLRTRAQLSETSLITISTAVGPWTMGPSGLRLTTRRKVGTTIPSRVGGAKEQG